MSVESVPDELVDLATAAVVQVHDDELAAYLRGEVPANQWRPEQYARAVLAAVSEAGWVPVASGHRVIEAPTPWPLFEHGAGRELSTKQWDDYKQPVVVVVPVAERDVARAQAEALAQAIEAVADGQMGERDPIEDERVLLRALRAFRESRSVNELEQ